MAEAPAKSLADGNIMLQGLARWFQILIAVQATTGLNPSRFLAAGGGNSPPIILARKLLLILLSRDLPRSAVILWVTALTDYSARSWAGLDDKVQDGAIQSATAHLERIEGEQRPLDEGQMVKYRKDGWIPTLKRKFG